MNKVFLKFLGNEPFTQVHFLNRKKERRGAGIASSLLSYLSNFRSNSCKVSHSRPITDSILARRTVKPEMKPPALLREFLHRTAQHPFQNKIGNGT